jgi:TonB family protein
MIADILSGLLRVNLASAVAILLVLLLRKPARGLFGARVAYALWITVPLVAAASLLPQPATVTFLSPIVLTASAAVGRGAPTALGGDYAAPLLAAVWLAGALITAILLVGRQGRFIASLGRLEPAIQGSGVLRAEHAGVGPAVVGALRPRIVTPADFETRFEAEEREVILAHEKVHLATGDARINALVAAAQCLSWFNPLVHVGVRLLRVDQEVACDAGVLARFPNARLYAQVLLKTQLASQSPPLGCHWPAAAEHPLKERIVMLRSPLPTPSRKAAGLAVVAALSLGGACAAWAANPAAPGLVTQPDWAQRPTGEDVARYYPAQAVKLGVSGGATIGCRVSQTGRLEHCAVLGEDPAQYGFGPAALKLSRHFQMRPMSRDGAPTSGGEVRIPILFRAPGDQPQPR